ncbi:MAG TPA: hypothetical protein VI756_18385 [Blastocatellia bacterium]
MSYDGRAYSKPIGLRDVFGGGTGNIYLRRVFQDRTGGLWAYSNLGVARSLGPPYSHWQIESQIDPLIGTLSNEIYETRGRVWFVGREFALWVDREFALAVDEASGQVTRLQPPEDVSKKAR